MRATTTAILILALQAAQTTAPLHAQPSARVPIIAGNGLVNVLVEIDGTVKTWGDPRALDLSPSLGNGIKPSAQPEVKAPQALAGVQDVASASVAVSHVLLLKRDGTVLAWGDNDSCQLGNGTGKASLVPVAVPGLRGAKQVAAAGWMSAAVLTDGSLMMWGKLAPKDCTGAPKKIDGLPRVTRVAIDGNSLFALADDGTVWSWGANKDGQLCDGTTDAHAAPVQVKGITNAIDLAVSGNSVVVLADGTVRMCGSNESGGVGDPAPGAKRHLTPFQVPGVTAVRSVRSESGTTIAHLADGTLRAWGLGWYGALGDGHGDTFNARPRAPIGLGSVLAHYMSHNTSYAIRADGTVLAWGGLLAPPGSKTEFILTPAPAFSVKLNQ